MESKEAATAPRKRRLWIKTAASTRRVKEEEEEEERRGEEEEEEEEEPVSPSGRLFHQRGFDCCIVAVIGLGKPIDVGAVKAGLEATFVRHPRFCSIPVLDKSGGTKSKWVRTKVAVEDHIVIPNLDPSGGGGGATSPDQVVEDYVSSLTSTPMDRSRPLWELHALNIPTSDAAAVAVLRVHHSLGDGASLMSLLLACTRKVSDADSLPTLPGGARQRRRPPDAGGIAFVAALLRIWAFLVVAWNTIVDAVLFAATAIFLKDTPTPLTGSEGVVFRPKRIVHRTVSLDDIKAVKKAMDCTVNDVLVGVISAGLSRYLSMRYEKNRLLSNIRLRSTLLVNIRPIPGIQDLAELTHSKVGGAKWGNLMGYIILPFTICHCKDPLDYVRRGKMIAERKKNSLEAIFTYKSAYLLVKCFGIKAAAYLCHRVLSHTTLSFSNIAGPVEAVEFFGHPLVYIAPTTYGHAQALTVHCQSYMNIMKVVVTVDEGVIPDPHQLVDNFAESLRAMREAIPNKA